MSLLQHPAAAAQSEADLALEGALIGSAIANAPYADWTSWQSIRDIGPAHFGDEVHASIWELIVEHRGKADLQLAIHSFPRHTAVIADLFDSGVPTMLAEYASAIRTNFAKLQARSLIATSAREIAAGRDPVAVLASLRATAANLEKTHGLATASPQGAFHREPFDAIRASETEWLAKNRLPAQGVGFLVGPSGTLKTFLALDWAIRIGEGNPVLNGRVDQVGVIYVAAEAPGGVRKRVEAWKRVHRHGVVPFEMIGRAPDLTDKDDVDDLGAELRLARDQFEARGLRLGLVVVDTLAAATPGADENTAKDMSPVMSHAAQLGLETGAFILIVAHTGKDEGRGLRGWSGQYAGADLVIMLSREEDSPVSVGKIAKLKEGESGFRFAFRLEQVSLGQDRDGDEITSAVVVYEDVPTGTKGVSRPLTSEQKIVLAAFNRCWDAGQTCSITRPDVAGHVLGVSRTVLKAAMLALGYSDADENPETVRRQINRHIKALIGRGLLKGDQHAVWLP